ncbi:MULTISPECIES: nitrous oxide reductase accessory protein NosL [Brevibacillus]|jgi:copper chaperone NosL|uniref:nitrous oxide reductase accessory protein NosL n=1 Tax=Brevibacillus TaxID=55080 RepID=UPI000469DDAC|nr:nitrous oxide reductase accessory protein NosL [Brevibacillus borstelensis]KKX52730.1 lipoprotein [Brevibacillus borstelensis cifa_chp40]MED1744476.1 nitrous oxide reductase accessory protein NosL [Brevibacillus borstelensis]
MKKWTIAAGAMMVASVLMMGCGKEEAQPVEIVEGVDKCDICHMEVANNQHATEIVLKDGKALKFDDIGCMYRWTNENGTEQVDVQFVRDYLSKEWVKSDQASYAYDESYKTPMGYGVYSFKEKTAAEVFVQEQQTGKVMSAQDLSSHSWESSMKKHKEEHGGGHNGDGQSGTHGANADANGSHTPSAETQGKHN